VRAVFHACLEKQARRSPGLSKPHNHIKFPSERQPTVTYCRLTESSALEGRFGFFQLRGENRMNG